jgi:hypothetical protein
MVGRLYSWSMNKKILKKFIVKDQLLKKELIRAHCLIILLSMGLMLLLTFSTVIDSVVEPALAFSAIILLAVVAVLSLSVVLTLIKKK